MMIILENTGMFSAARLFEKCFNVFKCHVQRSLVSRKNKFSGERKFIVNTANFTYYGPISMRLRPRNVMKVQPITVIGGILALDSKGRIATSDI